MHRKMDKKITTEIRESKMKNFRSRKNHITNK